jgi:hypothetical protein
VYNIASAATRSSTEDKPPSAVIDTFHGNNDRDFPTSSHITSTFNKRMSSCTTNIKRYVPHICHRGVKKEWTKIWYATQREGYRKNKLLAQQIQKVIISKV